MPSNAQSCPVFPAVCRIVYTTLQDEFSVSTDVSGEPAVGFFVGGGSTGVVCVPPHGLTVVKDSHKQVAGRYQELLRRSTLAPDLYLGPRLGGVPGHWGSILVRSNQRGDLMARVTLHQRDLCRTQVEQAREEVVEALGGLESVYLAVVALDGRRRVELVLGQPHLEETLGGRRLLLGPDSFLQGNLAAAEQLLQLVQAKVGSPPGRTATFLDLCCGVGTYSLQLATRSRGCIGVDVTDTALAATNATRNGITNCRFETGMVGAVMPALAAELRRSGAPVTAVLNPGRRGVDREVIQHLRSIPLLSSLVYVSCEPEDGQVVANLVDLTKEERGARGPTQPFHLREAIPLDMFPQTHHCEHVFVLKRKPA